MYEQHIKTTKNMQYFPKKTEEEEEEERDLR
jgi:hypothetical protein